MLSLYVCIGFSLLVATCAKTGGKRKIQVESTQGESVDINCYPAVNATKVTWKVGDDSITYVSNKFTFGNSSNVVGGVLTILNVDYTDRNDYTCLVQLPPHRNTTTGTIVKNATIGEKIFRLRVRDPLGAVWPTIGIIVEAVVLVIVIGLFEFFARNKSGSK